MSAYRKKPVIVEAEQWFPDSEARGVCRCDKELVPHLHTIHEGQTVRLEAGDFILPEPDGKSFYPVKAEIFEKIYEPVP